VGNALSLRYWLVTKHANAERGKTVALPACYRTDAVADSGVLVDLQRGDRQQAFRDRIDNSGLTTAVFTTPSDLETLLLQALTRLPRARRTEGIPVSSLWNIPARLVAFTGRERLLADLRAALCTSEHAVVQAVHGMGGVGKTTLTGRPSAAGWRCSSSLGPNRPRYCGTGSRS
jgi:hypothetical protein